MPENVIEVEDLRYTYGGPRYAVDGISFNVKRGEVFGILGRNGAGKTTTIRILTTLLQRTSGNIRVLGMDPGHAGNRLRSRIGVVLQDESFDFTTVEKGLDVYGYIWHVPKAERSRKIEELVKTFELDDFRKKRMWDLSGGQKRRVQVAREFMHDMDLLFLDEPTAGLDPIARRNILDMVKGLTDTGLSVVFTTHNLEEADYLCERIAIMNTGKIISNDTVSELKKNYSGLKTVEVRFAETDDEITDAMSSIASGKVEPPDNQDRTFRIVTSVPQDSIQEVLQVSTARSLHLEWVNVRSVSLEDVFIKEVSEASL